METVAQDKTMIKAIAKKIWEAKGCRDGESEEDWKIAEAVSDDFFFAASETAKSNADRVVKLEEALGYWKSVAERRGFSLSIIMKRPLLAFVVWLMSSCCEWQLIKKIEEDYEDSEEFEKIKNKTF